MSSSPSLPVDLIPDILVHLVPRNLHFSRECLKAGDFQDLFTCTLVHRSWLHFSQSCIYKRVRLNSRDGNFVDLFYAFLQNTPHVVSLVQELALMQLPIQLHTRETMSGILRSLPNLVHLQLHSFGHDPDYRDDRTCLDASLLAVLRDHVFPKLQSLRLFNIELRIFSSLYIAVRPERYSPHLLDLQSAEGDMVVSDNESPAMTLLLFGNRLISLFNPPSSSFVALKARHIEISRLDLHAINPHDYSILLVSVGQLMGWSLRVLELKILFTTGQSNFHSMVCPESTSDCKSCFVSELDLKMFPFLHTLSIRFVLNDLKEWTPQLSTLALKVAQLDHSTYFLRRIEVHLSCDQMENDEVITRAVISADLGRQKAWQEFDGVVTKMKKLKVCFCTNAGATTTRGDQNMHREVFEKRLGDCMKGVRDSGRLEIVSSVPPDYF
ncbi:hypothetical protein DL96DRAFT_1607567 [Flagelloscypha sp. PMI_526]|nr:hypothetical protein DL96DRAFT_1607567 [Flagelloscypha sp. PMI_526]